MARTFQITSLFPKLTVLDNVLLALAGVGWTKLVMWKPLASYEKFQARARQLLEAAGYWDRRDVEVRNLSHGEQRQIEVVLGLASDPKLLLLDEPAAGPLLGRVARDGRVPEAPRSRRSPSCSSSTTWTWCSTW